MLPSPLLSGRAAARRLVRAAVESLELRQRAGASAITVKYATADDTAKVGLDYSALSGTLTFAAGQTSKTVTVYVKADHVAELEERFFLKLTSPTNTTIAVGTGTGWISNDD